MAEDKARDDAEAAEDVTKRGDLSDFHRPMTETRSGRRDAGIGAGGRKSPRASEPASETAEQIAAREAKEAAEEKGRRLRAAAEASRARESREPNARLNSESASLPIGGGLETRERPKVDPAVAAAEAKEAAAEKAAAAKRRYLERKRKAT